MNKVYVFRDFAVCLYKKVNFCRNVSPHKSSDFRMYLYINKSNKPKSQGGLTMNNSKSKFETFLSDRSNGVAFITSQLMAEYPENAGDLLWLYGDSGYGKSHLLKGIYNSVNHKGDAGAEYVNAREMQESIMRDLISGQGNADVYKKPEYLIVDNMEYLTGMAATQREVADLFLDKSKNGQKVIIASNCNPQSLPAISRLCSDQLSQSVVAGVGAPSRALLARYAGMYKELHNINISEAALALLVVKADSIPQITGVLNAAILDSKMKRMQIDRQWVQEFMERFKG